MRRDTLNKWVFCLLQYPPAAEIQPSSQLSPVPSAASSDSRIISDFQEIFVDFQGKRFSLLCRGSRDGFKAQEFHPRCGSHANTWTVILDTKGNIFDGFTPVKWNQEAM
jgi:hypothetical protein